MYEFELILIYVSLFLGIFLVVKSRPKSRLVLAIWIIGIIALPAAWLESWPSAIAMLAGMVVYYFNQCKIRKKMETLENNITYYQEKITSSQNSVVAYQKELQSCEVRANRIELQLQSTREMREVISKDLAFFSALFKGNDVSMPNCIGNIDKAINEIEKASLAVYSESQRIQQEIVRESQDQSSFNTTISDLDAEIQKIKIKMSR